MCALLLILRIQLTWSVVWDGEPGRPPPDGQKSHPRRTGECSAAYAPARGTFHFDKFLFTFDCDTDTREGNIKVKAKKTKVDLGLPLATRIQT
jgi:hypothetical protein